jgi:hypothetical protein
MSMVEACMEAGIIIQASMRHFVVVQKYMLLTFCFLRRSGHKTTEDEGTVG